jgi:hypothetical protein
MKTNSEVWWGDYLFDSDASVQWEFATLRIAVQRLPHEWLVAYDTFEKENEEDGWHVAYGDFDLTQGQFAHISRYVFQDTTERLTVLPSLADRTVVSRPYTPFTVPAGEATTIYVGTPLWFTMASGSLQDMFEIPIQRPSDTWFGASTQEGELGYASRTYGRLNLENINISPYAAVTEVHIHNGSEESLLVERLNLPVPFLSLFETEEGDLWTEAVTVEQTEGTSLAKFHIKKAPLAAENGAKLIARPRQDPQKGMLIRAFGALKLHGFDGLSPI